jgi:DNA-directed RNA polymerase subunit M/transcription elongation factor TFIIS
MAKTPVRCPSCNKVLLLTKTDVNQTVTCPQCRFKTIVSMFQEVTLKQIVCPACKVILSIDPVYKGVLACPRCKYSEDVSNYAPVKKGDDTIGPAPDANRQLTRPAILVFAEGDCPVQPVFLKKGINTIGRRKTGSQSSIQLETTDEFISRIHAQIELAVKADNTFEYLLSDAGSANGTYHNGERLEKGEVVILSLKDKVRIGHTTFQFMVE